ncbi:MAG: tRNA (N6-isopentenyl adenosine(37)-C2)-methylthiotransferase MiaB [Bacillota bacterium]
MPLTYYIETFGCQMNERDSETIAALLERDGMRESVDPKKADVIILNTCAVRETAESKVWSRLGRLYSWRRGEERLPVMVLSGCMAQIPENLQRLRQRAPFVQVVAGPGNIHKIPGMVREALCAQAIEPGTEPPTQRQAAAVTPPRVSARRDESTQVLPEGLPRKNIPGVSAYVTIMYGCDNFCSYCVVPYVRGPQVSRSREAIRDEVADLVRRGYKEVTLLGQNVNAWGLDLPEKESFADLLRDLNRIPGLARIRYFTSHPRDFTREMVDAVRDCGKVCEHFHLPLQSGSSRILTLMNRGYSPEQYLDLLAYVREAVPTSGITTDIIVGFPGETEEDFQETLEVVRKARFDGAFTFIFSPRKGTAAAKMKGQIPRAEKSRRMQALVDLQSEVTRESNRALLGNVFEILVESRDPEEPGAVRGRTRSGKMVVATANASGGAQEAPPPVPGDLVKVRVEEAGTWYLKGPVVQ